MNGRQNIKHRIDKKRVRLFAILLLMCVQANLLPVDVLFASQSSGTIISDTYKQATVCTTTPCPLFSGNYINFKPTIGVGVSAITIDDINGIDGNAFGNYLGWISFGRTGTSAVAVDPGTGYLSGYAWAQNSGWINFSISTTTGVDRVKINNSGEWGGWAWAAGQYGGWIKFDCAGAATSTCVKTDWVPTSARTTAPTTPTGGGGGGGGGGLVITPTNSCPTISTNQNQRESDNTNQKRVDINDDGITDVFDFNLLIREFGKEIKLADPGNKVASCKATNISDINCDGQVNVLDFNLILIRWLFRVEASTSGLTSSDPACKNINNTSSSSTSPATSTQISTVPSNQTASTTTTTQGQKINNKFACPLINTTIKFGYENNINDVISLQNFLNKNENENLLLDGIYKEIDVEAVKRFQLKYSTEILAAWGLTLPSGWVYTSTQDKINKIACGIQ